MAARRAAPIAVLAGAALVPALALGGVWQYADANVPPPTTTTTTTTPPPPSPELDTDLLSYRRHPTPIADAIATAAAGAAISEVTDDFTARIGSGSCARVVDGDEVVASVGDDRPVVPASNQKLLVAAVALDVLGPEYRFRTELQSARPVGGVVPGDLYLVGGGDPVLWSAGVADPARHPAFNTTRLDDLVDQLLALGVTSIDGDVVGDGSRYDDEFYAPGWGDGIANVEAGPYDALLVDDGLLPGGQLGIDPNRAAAVVFTQLLTARGIAVGGAAANGPRPQGVELTTLALIESRPLTDVVVEMLHTSDDNTAELMVKEIGVAASGAGTRQAGLDAIRASLDRWGVPTAGLELYDGSGLHRGDRTTCATLVALLTESPVADRLTGLLPVAGRDGTLRDQFAGTPAEGTLQAKTGTLTDVKALSGVMPGADGRTVAFSVVLNQPDADEATVYGPVWNALVDLVDTYPVAVEPDVAAIAPRSRSR